MPKYVIYDERAYIVSADNEDDAFNRFISMNPNEMASCEVEGGGIEVGELEE